LIDEKFYHPYIRINLENYEIVYFEHYFILVTKKRDPDGVESVVRERAEIQPSRSLGASVSIDTIHCEISLFPGYGQYVKILDNQIPLVEGNEKIILLVEYCSKLHCFENSHEMKMVLDDYIKASSDEQKNTLLSILMKLHGDL